MLCTFVCGGWQLTSDPQCHIFVTNRAVCYGNKYAFQAISSVAYHPAVQQMTQNARALASPLSAPVVHSHPVQFTFVALASHSRSTGFKASRLPCLCPQAAKQISPPQSDSLPLAPGLCITNKARLQIVSGLDTFPPHPTFFAAFKPGCRVSSGRETFLDTENPPHFFCGGFTL